MIAWAIRDPPRLTIANANGDGVYMVLAFRRAAKGLAKPGWSAYAMAEANYVDAGPAVERAATPQ